MFGPCEREDVCVACISDEDSDSFVLAGFDCRVVRIFFNDDNLRKFLFVSLCFPDCIYNEGGPAVAKAANDGVMFESMCLKPMKIYSDQGEETDYRGRWMRGISVA
ncbi:hypothetical protein McpAg1_08010 [Methanocorpusculaceae archaeon Ag1]|uniref:Uncharacterized protein n=1 Tax=Methanorbis furvi TaxID=3028299 RepID=A0AAE4MB34_9EURY|nr:hypothetical protein [Methanocorpusculaceae archaeon Ag1]